MEAINKLGLNKLFNQQLGLKKNKESEDKLFYVVNPKDNLLSISQQFNISPSELKKINGLKEDKIYLGQVITLKNKNKIKNSENENGEKNVIKKRPSASTLETYIPTPVIYLPSINSIFPWENSKYRDTYYMDFGFTVNSFLDGLNYCLNAICWIQHHECYEEIGKGMLKSHYISLNIFFMNKLGEIVSGKQILLDFKTQAQKVPNSSAYDYQIKLLTDIGKNTYNYLSTGNDLHNEIFIEKKYKFKSGVEYPIFDNDRAYNILLKASLNNRLCDTNFIFSSVGEEREKIEKILDYISVAAIPFEIPIKIIKQLQTVFEFIAYASDLDSQTKILDELFNERGPIPLSPIYHSFYELADAFDPNGNTIGGYKQKQKGKTIIYNDDFIMEEILTILQNDILSKKQ